jgi:hypothetical protein
LPKLLIDRLLGLSAALRDMAAKSRASKAWRLLAQIGAFAGWIVAGGAVVALLWVLGLLLAWLQTTGSIFNWYDANVFAAVYAILGCLAVVVLWGGWQLWWWLPRKQVRSLDFQSHDPTDRADVEGNLRKTVRLALGGVAVLIGAIAAYLQFTQQLSEPSGDRTQATQQLSEPSGDRTQAGTRIFGTWCSSGVRMTISAASWSFHLPNVRTMTYPVESFQLGGDRVFMVAVVDHGTRVIIEFGNINSGEIEQIRGKSVGDAQWSYYNRRLKRC